MKETILTLVFLAYAIPFAYMIAVDFYEILKRLGELYNGKLRPALVVTVQTFSNKF